MLKRVFGSVLLSLLASASFAQPAIPPSLQEWVPWVLDSHPDLRCPLVGEARVCAWPGVLELTLDDRGGSFALRVYADRELDLPLPGDATLFPREVTLDGRPALLRRAGDAPALLLPRGEHRVAGAFRWQRLPESLPLPREIALVDLRLRGQRVARPHREAGGLLWLAAREAEANEEDSLAIEVYRRIQDGVPALLETRLLLRVAGAAREADLGEPLPPGFEPYELESGLPARYGRDRRLRVQLRPGEWPLRLAARSQGPLLELAGIAQPAPWPPDELWVFAADPAVRAVRLEGGASIDPQRTSLPAEWKSLPAFQITGGDTLHFAELRRGEPQPPPDELQVARIFWLAQAGDRFTSRDHLTGKMNQGGRLEMLEPATLGRAALARPDGPRADQVITRSPDGGAAGIELRSGEIDLEADATYPRDSELPAVGWNRDANHLTLELRVPPGWRLFATSGVDESWAWVDQWTLLDFFLLLVLVLAIFKLHGLIAAGVALPVLVLSWHEYWAGTLAGLLLFLLAFGAIAKLRPDSHFWRTLHRYLAVVLIAMLAIFVRSQWREGRYPQLSSPTEVTVEESPDTGRDGSGGGMEFGPMHLWQTQPGWFTRSDEYATSTVEERLAQEAGAANAPAAPPPPEPEAVEQQQYVPERISADKNDFSSAAGYLAKRSRQIDPNAVVQTGPGVPRVWSRSYSLSWQGPVRADQPFHLYLISPALGLALALLRIAGWLALVYLLLGRRDFWKKAPGDSPADGDTPEAADEPAGVARAALLLLAPAATALFLLATAAPAAAQDAPGAPPAEPPAGLLGELERRLTRPPECAPDCLELARLDLSAGAAELRIAAELHAAADTAWALPGPASSFAPAEVLLDGKPAAAIRLQEDGFLALRLAPGVHRVVLRGPARDSVALQFPLPPRVLAFAGAGFTIDGFREDQPPPGLVRIVRVLPSGEEGPAAAVELQPWLELGRQLDIGLPWMIHYRLRRLSGQGAAVLLRVPLLPGEAVTTAGVPVENGEALVSLEPGETEREWSTTLSERPSLELVAPAGRPWLERWELLCSPIWHCAASGLDPVRHMQDGEWRPEWRPWPGEKVSFAFVRPDGAPGQTTTLDSVHLTFEPGRRLLAGRLAIDARASRGGEQQIGLPEGAEVLSFTIDGNPVPVQNLGGKVAYTLEPGRRKIELRWRQDHRSSLLEKMPAVAIPGEATNVTLQVELPRHRWMLLTGGPDWGPVVVFWQDLVAVLFAAFLLGRYAPTPLRTLDWALLGIGLTQVPFGATLLVVFWLWALGDRSRPGQSFFHDVWQIFLVALGVVVLFVLFSAIHTGLLMQPDMQVAGAESYGSTLRWFDERVSGDLPQPWLLWVPIWVYRVVMLVWALWLAIGLLRWLPWAWRQLYREGRFFRLPAEWRETQRRRQAEYQARMAAQPAGPPPPAPGPPPPS